MVRGRTAINLIIHQFIPPLVLASNKFVESVHNYCVKQLHFTEDTIHVILKVYPAKTRTIIYKPVEDRRNIKYNIEFVEANMVFFFIHF